MVHFVQDSTAHAGDRQKRNADKNGKANVLLFFEGNLFLLSAVNLTRHVVINVGSSKLLPKYISPFRVLRRHGNAYTIKLLRRMRTHPTYNLGVSDRIVSTSLLPTMKMAHVQESPSDY